MEYAHVVIVHDNGATICQHAMTIEDAKQMFQTFVANVDSVTYAQWGYHQNGKSVIGNSYAKQD